VRSQPDFVAVVDGHVVAFITLLHHLPEIGGSTEITWMAVQAEHRRDGLGAMLIEAAVRQCEADGVSMLCVLTLGPSVPEEAGDNYAGTRAFYRRMGFVPLRELGLREWNDASALMLARSV
jgi:GNAT superfamily N-acetyltransferase